jgi:iron complex outermembrane receptor protein
VNYQYNNKYLVQASVRYDGSSAFGKNNKWGTFPAVSAGWRISGEKFMENVTIVNELKLRAGYGLSGNTQGFDPLIAQLRYGFSGRYYSNGQLLSAVAPVQNENPNLKWESTGMANFGLDFSIFKSRISGSIDYYDKKTSDLIYNYPVSATQYFYPILTANAGTIRNKGIEVIINASPVVSKNFTWRTSFNIAHNNNNVESLSNNVFTLKSIPTAYLGGKGQSGNWSQLIQEGYPIGTFNILHYTGKNASGVSTFQKADGTTTLAPTTADYTLPGNAQPSLIYGWSNTFVYRNFDLNFFFRGVNGNKILNGTLAGVNAPSDSKNNNIPRFTLGESYSDYNSYIISDRYLENGSYLRLDNATLGFNAKTAIPALTRLRFYVSANNLFVITKYRGIDPEINMGGLNPGIDNINYYPKTRSFIFGVNVIF